MPFTCVETTPRMSPIEQLYHERCATPSDIQGHLPTLKSLAENCQKIVEFGVRHGNSTIAFLHGLPEGGSLRSYEIKPLQNGIAEALKADTKRVNWFLVQRDIKSIPTFQDFPWCDLLMIDSLHTEEQIRFELSFAVCVQKYIVIHDVHSKFALADQPPGKGDGILPPIFEFLCSVEGGQWKVHDYSKHSHGLLVLHRHLGRY